MNFFKTLLRKIEDHISGQSSEQAGLDHFERAKQATRYAVFLATYAQKHDSNIFPPLKGMFELCHSHALAAGVAAGHGKDQIDQAIEDLCEADRIFLKDASDEEIKAFAQNAGTVFNSFIAEVGFDGQGKPALGGLFRV